MPIQQIELCVATERVVDVAMQIIEDCKQYLKQQGIDQWQNGYPNKQALIEDIAQSRGYVIMLQKEIVGYISIDFNGEPAYDTITEGSWRTSEQYAVIHRLSLSRKVRGQGVAQKVFELVEEMSLEQNVTTIRIDTHRDNKLVQHILDKQCYSYCGVVQLSGGERLGYDKLL